MKRTLAVILTLALCALTLSVGVSALSSDVTASAWESVELKALFFQDMDYVTSELAPEYADVWWYERVEEVDDTLLACTINMRGFAMSADGRYAYMGTLNGGSGVRGVVVMDTHSGVVTDLYYRYDGESGLSGSPFSYAKGIDTDDRGYVYVGFAFSKNYNVVNLGIASQREDGTLEEVYEGPVYEFGEPGDEGGIKVGVNGVEVAKVGDRYLCYVMTNYTYDALYCFDVTDPATPELNEDFGDGGVIIFSEPDCAVKTAEKTLDEGQYMAVDEDGTVWLCASFKEGGSGIMKIDPTGTACADVIELSGAYCVAHEGAYLLVGAKDGAAVTVLDDSSYETVSTVAVPEGYGDRVTRIIVIDDVLYVCNAGADSMSYNTIFAAPLTADAAALLDAQAVELNGSEISDETSGESESDSATTPDTPDVTTPESDANTGAGTSADTNTSENDTEDTTTTIIGIDIDEKKKKKKGCGSVLSVSTVALLVAGGALSLARTKDD